VATRAGKDKNQIIALNPIHQQPIRQDVTLTVSNPVAGQIVVAVFRRLVCLL
jgi:hypothetical protein